MTFSQNAFFEAAIAGDEDFPHPPGIRLSRALREILNDAGWLVADAQNWRDVGWSLAAKKNGVDVEVVLVSAAPEGWMMQIAPARVPGFFGRLLGGSASATRDDCYEVARLVERALSAAGARACRWRWNGQADRGNTTGTPTRFESATPSDKNAG